MDVPVMLLKSSYEACCQGRALFGVRRGSSGHFPTSIFCHGHTHIVIFFNTGILWKVYEVQPKFTAMESSIRYFYFFEIELGLGKR
jgi:hypothetical protein